jgi:hypothetical protein
MVTDLAPLHKLCSEAPETESELLFHVLHGRDIAEAWAYVLHAMRNHSAALEAAG